jgi:hypothetical protein
MHCSTQDQHLNWYQLWSMECRYWYDVDANQGKSAHTFYTEDGIFDIGSPGNRFDGLAEIKGFYDRRRAVGTRTTRHMVTNFELIGCEAASAMSLSIMSLFGADGAQPQQSSSAILVAESANRYSRGADGRWLVKERIFSQIFLDPDALPLTRIGAATVD